MDRDASSAFWKGISSRIATKSAMQWRTRSIPAMERHFENEAESRKKEVTPGTFTTKKVKTLPDHAIASSLDAESASAPKKDYGLAARTAIQNVQQELATIQAKLWVRSELENIELYRKLDILEKTTKEENSKESKKQGLKLNVISGKTFDMTREETGISSIISVAGHQVVKNLNETSEIAQVHLDI